MKIPITMCNTELPFGNSIAGFALLAFTAIEIPAPPYYPTDSLMALLRFPFITYILIISDSQLIQRKFAITKKPQTVVFTASRLEVKA